MISYDSLKIWVECCSAVWGKIRELEDSEEIFSLIESAMFSILVIHKYDERQPVLGDCQIFIRYGCSGGGLKQTCQIQSDGSIFCKSSEILIDSMKDYEVVGIDPAGTMMDGEPYLEVKLAAGGFFLQPFDDSFEVIRRQNH